MRFAALPILIVAPSIKGFAPVAVAPKRSFTFRAPRVSTESTTDFASAMPSVDAVDPYRQLGLEKDKVALGLDVNEVLQWIGTREDLVERIMKDNKNFSRERAELEAEKLFMDAEVLNYFIQYEKYMASRPEEERESAAAVGEWYENPKIWGTYVAWILGGFGFSYVKKNVVDPKFASGEWEPIALPWDGLIGGAKEAAEAASSTVETISDTASSAM